MSESKKPLRFEVRSTDHRAQLLVDGVDISRLVRRYRIEHDGGELPRLSVEFVPGGVDIEIDKGAFESLFSSVNGTAVSIHNQTSQPLRVVRRPDGSGDIDVYIGEPSED